MGITCSRAVSYLKAKSGVSFYQSTYLLAAEVNRIDRGLCVRDKSTPHFQYLRCTADWEVLREDKMKGRGYLKLVSVKGETRPTHGAPHPLS